MPILQKPQDANAIRIRNNQRRSRARRKEYAQELEGRLREYELKGVKVAQEIQDAAKAVVEENRQLRKVLDDIKRDSCGATQIPCVGRGSVKADELERSLRKAGSWHDTGTSSGLERESRTWKPNAAFANVHAVHPGPMSATDSSETSSLSPAVHPGPMSATGSSETSSLSPAGMNISNESDSPRIISQHTNPASPTFSQHYHPDYPSEKLKHPSCLPKEPEPVTSALGSELNTSDDTTSCAFAVAVLTSMRSDVSAEEVQAELGCRTDPSKCKVDNKRLFTAVDRYTGG